MPTSLNIKAQVSIEEKEQDILKTSDIPIKMGDGYFELQLSDSNPSNVDNIEAAVMQTIFSAARNGLSIHFEEYCKKEAHEVATEKNGKIVENKNPYKIEGGAGRYQFPTYDVYDAQGTLLFETRSLLPTIRPNQYYQTRGFKDAAFFQGSITNSFRNVAKAVNAHRYQPTSGTPHTTLRDNAEKEGKAVMDYTQTRTQNILKYHGFDENGLPKNTDNLPNVIPIKKAILPDKTVKKTLNVPAKLEKGVLLNPVRYENKAKTVFISPDGVQAKKQKEKRQKPKEGKKRVHIKTATIEYDEKKYRFVAESYSIILCFVLAFLLHNKRIGLRLCFLVDGERTLNTSILKYFGWHPKIIIMLDWSHMIKKCGRHLRAAVPNKEIRLEYSKEIRRYLWFGCVDKALKTITSIPIKAIANKDERDRLIEYLQRNRPHIPCYAVRKQLGLPNSSNRAESENNQLVSRRQKGRGISWSDEGSLSLAALTMVTRNGHKNDWLRKQEMPFRFANAA